MSPRQDCTCGHTWSAHLPLAGATLGRCTLDCLDGCTEYVAAGPRHDAPIWIVEQDRELTWRLRCPACGHSGDIDRDQAQGRISVDHSGGTAAGGCGCGCGYHETRDWLSEYRDAVSWQPVFTAIRQGRLTLGGAAAFLGVSDLEIARATIAEETAP